MVSSLCTRQLTSSVVALACTAAVVVFGELSTGALLAVGGTGVLAAAVGLARHAGEAAAPVGRRGLPWLASLAAGLAWEVVTLLDDDLPTLSGLADPLLAHPPVRAAATVGWLVAGAWLLARPGPLQSDHDRQRESGIEGGPVRHVTWWGCSTVRRDIVRIRRRFSRPLPLLGIPPAHRNRATAHRGGQSAADEDAPRPPNQPASRPASGLLPSHWMVSGWQGKEGEVGGGGQEREDHHQRRPG